MGAKALTIYSYIFFVFLLIPIFTANFIWKLNIGKKMVISIVRMVLQLLFVGVYLKYLFQLDNNLVNFLYILIMVLVAAFSVIRSSEYLRIKRFLPLIFLGTAVPTIIILLMFNKFVVGYDNIFSSRYMIPIGGMLLGNSLRANIIGIKSLTEYLKDRRDQYQTLLMLGSSRFESISDLFFKSLKNAIEPTIASIATIGLVSLPGMMTGQILGGSAPTTAIQYQIAIMLAIFGNMFYSVVINIFFVYRKSFDNMDRLRY